MIKFLEIKGLNVIDSRGNTKGIIEDGVLDMKNKRICSFIVSQRGIFTSYLLLSIKNIRGFGGNVIIDEEIYTLNKMVVKKNRESMMSYQLNREVVSSSGNILGNLADVIIDERSGKIRALLCTRGVLDDLIQGRRLIITDSKTVFGGERIMVGEDCPEIINDVSFKKFLE